MDMSKKLKSIKELDPINEGETVVLNPVTDEFMEKWRELTNLSQDLMALLAQLKRMDKKRDALSTLFWDGLKENFEQVDRADRQGLAIGIRKDEHGIPVIVAFDSTEDSDAHPLAAILRRLMEEGGG